MLCWNNMSRMRQQLPQQCQKNGSQKDGTSLETQYWSIMPTVADAVHETPPDSFEA
jgi:hypothetical protein